MRVRIGCQVDHDASHYAFARQSGIPHGTFDDPVDWFVVCTWAASLIGAAGLVCAFFFNW